MKGNPITHDAYYGTKQTLTLFARTRKIPNFSSIAHCVTILRSDTRRRAVTEVPEQQTGVHGWGANLTFEFKLRIVTIPDP